MISRRVFAGLAVMALAPPAAFSQSPDGVRRLSVLLAERPDNQIFFVELRVLPPSPLFTHSPAGPFSVNSPILQVGTAPAI